MPSHDPPGDPGPERKELALQGALEKLAPGPWIERPDTPDGVVTAVRRLPPVEARYAPFPEALDPRLRAALGAAASRSSTATRPRPLRTSPAGRNVVVTTPTASGKTLCYNLPVLDAILQRSRGPRAVSLPDQGAGAGPDGGAPRAASASSARPAPTPIGVHTYDGDTPADARRTIRTRAHVVLSNPDMLHSGILPHHPRWAKLFENLRYIVIDELHAYRGVFGSHLVQRAAAAAAHRAALRLRSADRLLVRDHRQSARAGRAARRAAVRARVARAARRAARSSSSSSTRRSSIASSAFAARISPKRGAWPASSCAAICR